MDDLILEQAVAIGLKLADNRLIRSSEGNLSLRRDETSFLITPSGSKIHALNQRDFVVVEFDGAIPTTIVRHLSGGGHLSNTSQGSRRSSTRTAM